MINKTLSHEYYRCSFALNEFYRLKDLLRKNNTTENKVNCYNFYVDFISHLFEFYIPFIEQSPFYKQEGPYKDYPEFMAKKPFEIKDIIITEEVRKLFRNRKNRILRGEQDNLGIEISFYEKDIPDDFGQHFRLVRNCRSHANRKRFSTDVEIHLADFFRRYNTIVLVLYKECEWLWKIKNKELPWKPIDNFIEEILKF